MYCLIICPYLNKYWSTCWYDWSQISKLMWFKCTSRCFILLKEKWSVGTIIENPVKLVGSPNTKHYIQINEVILHCHQGSHQAFICIWKILLLLSYCYSLNVSPDQWMQLMGRRRCVCVGIKCYNICLQNIWFPSFRLLLLLQTFLRHFYTLALFQTRVLWVWLIMLLLQWSEPSLHDTKCVKLYGSQKHLQ